MKLFLIAVPLAGLVLPPASVEARVAFQGVATSKPAVEPVLVRVYKTGDERKPQWSIMCGTLNHGTLQIREHAAKLAAERKKAIHGLTDKDPTFATATVDQVAVIECEPDTPFGYARIAFEAFAMAGYNKFEFKNNKESVLYTLPTLEEYNNKKRRAILDVTANFDKAKGLILGVGMEVAHSVEEVLKMSEEFWRKYPKVKGERSILRFFISSARVPWAVAFDIIRGLDAKRIGPVDIVLPEPDFEIARQPREGDQPPKK